MKTLHLEDNWKAFSMAIEERFTDRQEQGKDHEKLLALEYQGDVQTYLAKFNELKSSVDHGSPRFAPRFAKTPHQNFRRN